MTDPIFAAPRTKVQRAKGFVAELSAETQRYIDSKPCTVKVIQPDPATPPTIEVRWDGIGLTPGAIIGDAIHNLRTALDLMASELATLNGKSNKDVYFPLSDSAETLDDAIKRRRFDKAGDDAVALLRTIKPYRGGNELLRLLHDLDISDKHTALVPVGALRDIKVAGAYSIDDPLNGCWEVEMPNASVIFPDDAPMAGRPIVEALEEMVQLVESILETFGRLIGLQTVEDQFPTT